MSNGLNTLFSPDCVLGTSPTVKGERGEEPPIAWAQFKGQPVVTSSWLSSPTSPSFSAKFIAASDYFSCPSLRLEYSALCSHKWFLIQVSGQIVPFRSLMSPKESVSHSPFRYCFHFFLFLIEASLFMVSRALHVGSMRVRPCLLWVLPFYPQCLAPTSKFFQRIMSGSLPR